MADPDTLGSMGPLLREVAHAPRLDPPAELEPGVVVGGTFRVDRKLGRGGMGVVYLAHDVTLGRDVALKITSGSVDEARTMARLAHPNVVTVHAVGAHEDRLYIAMEYVDGGTLRDVPADRALERYLEAARGLAAAHAAGLVHRDFKPDNVLIGKDGRARVADFGLAGAAESAAAGAGTPGWMAPEQRRGESDARSDQWAFCRALDRALGDRAPRWLRAALARGQADDPARRWPSMDALIAHIEKRRFRRRASAVVAAALVVAVVAGATAYVARPGARPVSACAGSDERLAEVWNDRVRATLAGPDAVAAAGALDAYAAEWIDAHRGACAAADARLIDARLGCLERARAQVGVVTRLLATPSDRALDAINALPRVADCVAPPPAPSPAVAALERRLDETRVVFSVERSTGAVDTLRQLLAEARALDDPRLTGEILFVIGRFESELGKLDDAVATTDDGVRQALASGDDRLAAEALAELAYALSKGGRTAEAERAIAQAEALLRHVPAGDDAHAVVTAHRAHVLAHAGSYEEAVRVQERAVELARAGHRWTLARALENLASHRLDAGHPAAARASAVEAAELFARIAGPSHPDTLEARLSVATIDLAVGDVEAAAGTTREVLAEYERRYGKDDPRLVRPLDHIGYIRRASGDPDGAIAAYERVLALGGDRDGRVLANIGMCHIDAGRLPAGLDHARRALAVMQARFGGDHPELVKATQIVGTIERYLGDVESSARDLEAAVALAARTLPREHPDRLNAEVELALTRLEQGRAAEAIPLLEPAVAAYTSRELVPPPTVSEAQFALARALWEAKKDRARAVALARQAHATSDAFKAEIDAWLASRSK